MTPLSGPASQPEAPAKHRLIAFSLGLLFLALFAAFRHFDKPMVLLAIGGSILLPWIVMAHKDRQGRQSAQGRPRI